MREPPRDERDLGAGQGKKREGHKVTGHGKEAGTRYGAQRREAEAGGWSVWVTSRWTALYAGRGGGERVQEIGDTRKNATDWEVVG